MKTIILLFLLLVSFELYSQEYTYHYFYSRQDDNTRRQLFESWGLVCTQKFLVIGEDTVEFTQTAYSSEPSRKYNDIRYIGYGVYDKYEWVKNNLYVRIIWFKRNG